MNVEYLLETERLQMQNKKFKVRSLAAWCVETFSSKNCWQYTETDSVLVNTAKQIVHLINTNSMNDCSCRLRLLHLTPMLGRERAWPGLMEDSWGWWFFHPLCSDTESEGDTNIPTTSAGGRKVCVIVCIFALKILGWFWWCLFGVAILWPTLLNSSCTESQYPGCLCIFWKRDFNFETMETKQSLNTFNIWSWMILPILTEGAERETSELG